MRKIVLASASPRRKEILSKTGFEFEIMVSGCDENIDEKRPDRLVMKLSALKAEDVAEKNENALIIGSDTVVAHKGEILGKPASKEDAVRMIKSFAGDRHQVYTGVTVIVTGFSEEEKEKILKACKRLGSQVCESSVNIINIGKLPSIKVTFCVCTDVHVLPMTDKEIENYVETGEPMDKAGAYAIQGLFAPFISKIDGDYYNVVGLPIASLYMILKSVKEDA